MAELTYRDAVIRGIAQEMQRDPDVVFLGEDVAKAGGVFKATVGLYEQFGPLRVRDTPISEQAILGAAMGAAMTGLKPIAEIMYGVREFSAIINPPHATILAVGATRRAPVEADDGSVKFISQMTVTLSCDHRVVDGALGAELLASFKDFIEKPVTALV